MRWPPRPERRSAGARHPGLDPAISGRGGRAAHLPSVRYPIVDAVRGLSILLVVLRHIQLRVSLEPGAAAGPAAHALWQMLCTNGNEGVRLFFVVSGFLITSTTIERWGALPAVRARHFYGLRLARIVPTLAALLGVLSVLHLAGAVGYVVDARVSLGRALVAASTFHVNWLEASRGLYLPASWDVLWSLGVEEVFYLFFPLVCLLYRSSLAGHALLIGLVVAGAVVRCALVNEPMWQSKAYLASMDGIALGCLTAALTHGRRFSARFIPRLAVGGATLALAVLLLAKAPAFVTVAKLRLHLPLLSLGCAGLLVAGTRLSLRPAVLALLRPLRACGRLSYEIYLTHMFVVLAAARLFHARGWPPAAAFPLAALVSVACWALGALVARYLSSPANRWLRSALAARAEADEAAAGARPVARDVMAGR